MLFWETIQNSRRAGRPVRLPGDNRCAAITKAGTRCRGRTCNGSPWCVFHDPGLDLAARRHPARYGARTPKRTRYHLDGVAGRLTSRKGITEALDRLYNETREGLIAPETGQVLFNALERLLEAYYKSRAVRTAPAPDRSRAARLCRRLARTYISMVDQQRAGSAAAGEPKAGMRTTELIRSVAERPGKPRNGDAQRGKLKLPPLEQSPPATVPWPADLTAREA